MTVSRRVFCAPLAHSTVLAVASLIGACTIGYTTVWIQVAAGLAVVFDGVWILMVSIYLWRDPALTAP
jgi:hypothetical protein